MAALNVLVFAVGLVLVVFTLASAVRTIVVPRAIPVVLSRVIFLVVRIGFRALSGRSASYERRDRIMALYAPVALLTMPAVWLALIAAGYLCMYWAMGVQPVREAFELSGSSLFTLGFTKAEAVPTQLLVFSEAAAGVGTLALLITYLPSLYSTFARREATIALLESRAGGARSRFGYGPSGVEMLWRYQAIGWRRGLDDVWPAWEQWFVELEESHTSLPALAFFRSPQPDRSWVTASGAVLDAASLWVSSVEGVRTRRRSSASAPAMSPCGTSPTSSTSRTTPTRSRATRSPSSGRSGTRPATTSPPRACRSGPTATPPTATSPVGA